MNAARVILCFCLAATASEAEDMRYMPEETGAVRPWSFHAIPSNVREAKATPAELKAIQGSVRKLTSLILALPLLNPPRGFEAFLSGSLMAPDPDQARARSTAGLPLDVWLLFGALEYYAEADRSAPPGSNRVTRKVSTTSNHLEFYINDLRPVILDHIGTKKWTDAGGDLYLEPAVTGELAGFPLYNDLLAITRPGESIWAPVPVERFLRMAVAELKPGGGPDIERARQEAASQLAGLDAAGRQSPACITGTETHALWKMKVVPPGTPGCRAVVQPNLGLFRPKLPRSAIQVITVEGIKLCREVVSAAGKKPLSPGDCTANLEIVRQLDWRQVAALIEQ